ncbi:hypothetical protein SAMN04515671_1573 [Nakamurella panacisegetis]|uniref:Uncharacterized protein n=1 Tax=Nakamurella panacisegetis TaxID=1090615 RepID=A0A1H0L8H3_9ACTN|nr:hypothetical protein [Nakamurella panacisegetis]SDO64517.1 hypothetical protein SAMN04515671_1573 [Nakamurella panacisegetis]
MKPPCPTATAAALVGTVTMVSVRWTAPATRSGAGAQRRREGPSTVGVDRLPVIQPAASETSHTNQFGDTLHRWAIGIRDSAKAREA